MPDMTHHNDNSHDDHVSLLDLDAEVLGDYWSSALDFVQQAAATTAGGRLLDLGAGTGTGAMGLAQRFPTAEVIAVDLSTESLDRLRAKATDAGIAPRVVALEADLDADWPAVGIVDVTWASMSLHHFADPDQVLRDVLASTRPGGVLAVAEFASRYGFCLMIWASDVPALRRASGESSLLCAPRRCRRWASRGRREWRQPGGRSSTSGTS
jgi:ubiquinone/menaquinone biosynthesis C-methylase UbiE